MLLDPRDFTFWIRLLFRRIGYLPNELMRLIWNSYLELYALMIIDRTNRRRYIDASIREHDLEFMFDLNRDDDHDDWKRRYGPGF